MEATGKGHNNFKIENGELQYAKLILVFERSLDSRKLVASLMEYSIRMNDPGRESRGLMVIKQTTKTRAFQRKQAISNWKVKMNKMELNIMH